jgi:hypothetical protein
MNKTVMSALISSASNATFVQIARVLGRSRLAEGEKYADVSAVLQQRNIDVDTWPVPPAGLFVVDERCVYLRSFSDMTIAHEFGHAIDCALGNGTYLSERDTAIRHAFATATRFVTPYAHTSEPMTRHHGGRV